MAAFKYLAHSRQAYHGNAHSACTPFIPRVITDDLTQVRTKNAIQSLRSQNNINRYVTNPEDIATRM
eukprot:1845072-Amphidinium_carterae.1